MRATWLLLAVSLLCCSLAGCGVPLQSGPEDLTVPARDSVPRPTEGFVTTTVFLVEDGRLVAVERATTEASPRGLLLSLVGGATTSEASAGVRSALVPRSLSPTMLQQGPEVRGRVVEVAVTERFTETSAADQLLATAQLVWTLTEWSSASLVRAVLEGEAIELPTDRGLSSVPVGRSDYASVAPTPDTVHESGSVVDSPAWPDSFSSSRMTSPFGEWCSSR